MTNSLKLILLCALILSGALIFWGYSLRVNSDIKKENKLLIEQYQKELQARRNVEKQVITRDSLYSKLRRHDKEVFDSTLKRSTRIVLMYRERVKEPIKPYNTKELDSLINLLTQ